MECITRICISIVMATISKALKTNSIDCTRRSARPGENGSLQCHYAPAKILYHFSYWLKKESEGIWAEICQCYTDNTCTTRQDARDKFLCEAEAGLTTLYIRNVTKQDQRLYMFDVTWENLVMQKEVYFTLNINQKGDEGDEEGHRRLTYPVTRETLITFTQQSGTDSPYESEGRGRGGQLSGGSRVILYILPTAMAILIIAGIVCHFKKRMERRDEQTTEETDRCIQNENKV